jgi:hypothetical protein
MRSIRLSASKTQKLSAVELLITFGVWSSDGLDATQHVTFTLITGDHYNPLLTFL